MFSPATALDTTAANAAARAEFAEVAALFQSLADQVADFANVACPPAEEIGDAADEAYQLAVAFELALRQVGWAATSAKYWIK